MWVYLRVDTQPITAPGIYHNSDLWLISLSSDGSNWLTIADKNLWATTVWNSWDTLSESNCGKYYQRWNNYWFARTWSVSTSSSTVNASTYWPWNYYNSSIFRTVSNGWDSSNNYNLRWYTTWTVEAMQWPCATGFHIPLQTEWANIKNIWTTIWGWASAWTNFSTALKLPFSWMRSNDSSIANQGSDWPYWSTSPSWTYNALTLNIGANRISYSSQNNRAFGQSIRPFANTATQPDESWTVLYQPS